MNKSSNKIKSSLWYSKNIFKTWKWLADCKTKLKLTSVKSKGYVISYVANEILHSRDKSAYRMIRFPKPLPVSVLWNRCGTADYRKIIINNKDIIKASYIKQNKIFFYNLILHKKIMYMLFDWGCWIIFVHIHTYGGTSINPLRYWN